MAGDGSTVRSSVARRDLACGLLIAAVAALVWAERSRFLFSWDSGNFALALSGIDIALHRPHPPGYVGYVIAARLLQRVVSSANDAFIAWNIIAMSVAAVALYLTDAADPKRATPLIAAAALLCSPLLLFYASTAEIYPSELAAVAVIAFTANRVVRGTGSAWWLLVAFGVGALFKLSSALFLLPLIAYALWHTAPALRRRWFALLASTLAIVAAVFLVLEPALLSIVWKYFLDTTARSRVVGSDVSFGRALNRNLRDTLIALMSALGMNSIGVIGWLVRWRRSPRPVDSRLLLLWIVPWCAVLPLVHIGKPGYVLPLMPVAALIAAEWYASRGGLGLALAACGCAVNLFWFALLPASNAAADTRPYHEKPLLGRLASDLAPLKFPTVTTLRESDATMMAMLDAAGACPAGSWVVVAGSYGADWRRTMFYLPRAVAIRQSDDGAFEFIGRNGMFTPIVDVQPLTGACGLLWVSDKPPHVVSDTMPTAIPSVGWRLGPGSGAASQHELRWTVD